MEPVVVLNFHLEDEGSQGMDEKKGLKHFMGFQL
jgi:hypothetical protein